MKRDEILDYLRELKASLPGNPLLEIGLFGSQARERAEITSDIDLFVRFDPNYLNAHDVWDYFKIMDKIKECTTQRFGHHVDIVDRESNNAGLREMIVKEGIGV